MKLESFKQIEPRTIECVRGHAYVMYWCHGCERKAYIHKERGRTTVHLDMLQAGESIVVPVGKTHYDGSVDVCDVTFCTHEKQL
jgi:hypothetical protein